MSSKQATVYSLDTTDEGTVLLAHTVTVTERQVRFPRSYTYRVVPIDRVTRGSSVGAYTAVRYAFSPDVLVDGVVARADARVRRAEAELRLAEQDQQDAMALAKLHAAGRIPTIHSESEQ